MKKNTQQPDLEVRKEISLFSDQGNSKNVNFTLFYETEALYGLSSDEFKRLYAIMTPFIQELEAEKGGEV